MAARAPADGPFSEHPLTGYLGLDELDRNGTVRLHASGPAVPGRLTITRAAPPAPGEQRWGERPVDWADPIEVSLAPRALACGSYVQVEPGPTVPGTFTFAVWCRPTLLDGGWHALASQRLRGEPGWALFVTAAGVLSAVVHHGGARWCAAKDPLVLDVWQLVAVTHDASGGRLTVVRWNPATSGAPSVDAVPVDARAAVSGDGRLLIGAYETSDGVVSGHFNGKLARPVLVRAVLAPEVLASEALADDGAAIAAWRFERDVSALRIADSTGHGYDAEACNAPLRAVTGPGWRGRPGRRYTDAPADYDAIHLHADDLDDTGWPVSAEIAIGRDVEPGIHLARLRTPDDELCVPFVVVSDAQRHPLAYLVPTLTWQAYASDRSVHEFAEDGVVDGIGGLYDLHPDGSPRHLSSRLRPTRAGVPDRGARAWGAHTVAADLMLTGGLQAIGFEHDVLADRQLHQHGAALLARYRCIVVGPHPEYTTAAMRDAFDAYLDQGGRIVYLGGNGFYWVTSLDPARPHLMEVRKGGLGEVGPEFKSLPGQAQHQTTLEDGGFWSERGRPPRALTGVEFVANGHVDGRGVRGFERLPAAADPRYAWVFAGVDENPLGAYGANLGSAVGYEMDAVLPWSWSDARLAPVVLARCADDTLYGPRLIPVAPVADIALRVLPDGGATFAAGSVTWSGSLAENGFANGVARVTANVLRRFLDTPPGQPVTGD